MRYNPLANQQIIYCAYKEQKYSIQLDQGEFNIDKPEFNTGCKQSKQFMLELCTRFFLYLYSPI